MTRLLALTQSRSSPPRVQPPIPTTFPSRSFTSTSPKLSRPTRRWG
jgi:hypothetical protein